MVVDAAMLCAEGPGGELLEDLRALRPEIDTFAPVPPAAMDALVDAADPSADSPLVVVELRHLGGAVARSDPEGGALDSIAASLALHCGDPRTFFPASTYARLVRVKTDIDPTNLFLANHQLAPQVRASTLPGA